MNDIFKIEPISRVTVADGDNLNINILTASKNDDNLLLDSNSIYSDALGVSNTISNNSATNWNKSLIHNFDTITVKQYGKSDILLTGAESLQSTAGFTVTSPLTIAKNDNNTYSIIAPDLTASDGTFKSYYKDAQFNNLTMNISPVIINSKYNWFSTLYDTFAIGLTLTTATENYPSTLGILLGHGYTEPISSLSAENADKYKNYVFSSYITPTGIELCDTTKPNEPVVYTVYEQTIPTNYSFIYSPDTGYYGRAISDDASFALGTKFISLDHSIAMKGSYASAYSISVGQATNGADGTYIPSSAFDHSVCLNSNNDLASAYSYLINGRFDTDATISAVDHSMVVHTLRSRNDSAGLLTSGYSLSLLTDACGTINNSVNILTTNTNTDAVSADNHSLLISVAKPQKRKVDNSLLLAVDCAISPNQTTSVSYKNSTSIAMKGSPSTTLENSHFIGAWDYPTNTTVQSSINTFVAANESFSPNHVKNNQTDTIIIANKDFDFDSDRLVRLGPVSYNPNQHNLLLASYNSTGAGHFQHKLMLDTNCVSSMSICPGGIFISNICNTSYDIKKSIFLKGATTISAAYDSVLAGNNELSAFTNQSVLIEPNYTIGGNFTVLNSAFAIYSTVSTAFYALADDVSRRATLDQTISLLVSTANMPSAFAGMQSRTSATTLVDTEDAYKQIALCNATAYYEYDNSVQAVTRDDRLAIWDQGHGLRKSDLLHTKLHQLKTISSLEDLIENDIYIITG